MAKSKKPKKSAKAKKPTAKKPAAKKPAAKKPAAKVSKAAKAKKPVAKAKKPAAPKAKGKKPAVKKSTKAPKTAKKSAPANEPIFVALDDPGTGGGGPGEQPVATPAITTPANGSTQTGGQNLAVSGTININTLTYQLELIDISGSPPYPASYFQTVNVTPPATTFAATIPAAQVQSGKTYKLIIRVHPSSGNSPPHSTGSVTFTT